jgi:hypothetical protein
VVSAVSLQRLLQCKHNSKEIPLSIIKVESFEVNWKDHLWQRKFPRTQVLKVHVHYTVRGISGRTDG